MNKKTLMAMLLALVAVAPVGAAESVDCSKVQNMDYPGCAGGPVEQAQDGTPGPFSQAD